MQVLRHGVAEKAPVLAGHLLAKTRPEEVKLTRGLGGKSIAKCKVTRQGGRKSTFKLMFKIPSMCWQQPPAPEDAH